jgi:hypothetical protein
MYCEGIIQITTEATIEKTKMQEEIKAFSILNHHNL